MGCFSMMNPFARRDSYGSSSLFFFQVLTIASWLVSVAASVYYSFEAPEDGPRTGRTIWDQNDEYSTAFTMNPIVVQVYFVILFLAQLVYIGHLFSSNHDKVHEACSVGSHFIFNNLLHFGFVMLFVRSFFGWAELLLIVNYFNLSNMYFFHWNYARFIHVPAVSGPLSWTFVAIFWNGAVMFDAENIVARIVANIFIWVIMLYGLFFVFFFLDYSMGFNLSVLMAAVGVAQFINKVVALQWIFAFVIMAVLFVCAFSIAVPIWLGREIWSRRDPPADTERAPLLATEQADRS